MNIYANGLGHMNKMAAMPLYMVKSLKNLQNQEANDLGTWYVVLRMWGLPICSNDDPRLTLTYFTARSNLFPLAFIWEKC